MAEEPGPGAAPRTFAVVHGPNLNLLGRREPELYGTVSLDTINQQLSQLAEHLGVGVAFFQSNHEGQLIDHIQSLATGCSGIVINAGGLTHTSVSLADALRAVGLPYIEVHLSNLAARESFRHTSMLAAHATGVISGLGPLSYELALRGLATLQ